MNECPYIDKIEGQIERLSDSIDELNKSVTILSGVIPTLATKEEVLETRDEVGDVKALATSAKIKADRAYWVVSVIVAAATFLVGFIIH